MFLKLTYFFVFFYKHSLILWICKQNSLFGFNHTNRPVFTKEVKFAIVIGESNYMRFKK